MREAIEVDPGIARWSLGDDPSRIVQVMRQTLKAYRGCDLTAFHVAPYVYEAYCVYMFGRMSPDYIRDAGLLSDKPPQFGYYGVPLKVDPTERFISVELKEEAVPV